MGSLINNTPCRLKGSYPTYRPPWQFLVLMGLAGVVLSFCVAIAASPPALSEGSISDKLQWAFTSVSNGLQSVFDDGSGFARDPELYEPYSDKNNLRLLVRTYSRQYRVPEDLIWAVITVESNFDPRARSRAGAMGLMQLMPDTAVHLDVKNPYDPRENIRGGTQYIRELLNRFSGDRELALAAYNAGPAAVRKYRGIPPYPETRKYVRKVLKLYGEAQSRHL